MPLLLRLQAGEPLGQFLDYCTYGHMIDNVVLIVTGTLHERDVQVGAGLGWVAWLRLWCGWHVCVLNSTSSRGKRPTPLPKPCAPYRPLVPP